TLAAPSSLVLFSLPTSQVASGLGILPFVETSTNNPCDAPTAAAPCGLPACQQALRDACWRAGHYQSLHQRATRREAQLRQQLAQRQADGAARLRQREGELQQRI